MEDIVASHWLLFYFNLYSGDDIREWMCCAYKHSNIQTFSLGFPCWTDTSSIWTLPKWDPYDPIVDLKNPSSERVLGPVETGPNCKRPRFLTSHHHPHDVNQHRTYRANPSKKKIQMFSWWFVFPKSIFRKQYKIRSESTYHNVGFGER